MLQHFSSVFQWRSLGWSHVACVIRCSTKALWPPFITSILHQLKPLLPQMSIVTALWYRAKCIDFHFVHFSLTSTIHSLNKHLNMRPIMERKRKRVWAGCNRGGRILGNTTFSQTCLQAHTHCRWQSYLFGPEQGHVLTAGPVFSNLFFQSMFHWCFLKKYTKLLAKTLFDLLLCDRMPVWHRHPW